MTVRRIAAGAAIALAFQASSALAQFNGTPEEQQACKRDAIKFCREASQINDSLRVLACLKDNRPKISKACQKVLENHGQ